VSEFGMYASSRISSTMLWGAELTKGKASPTVALSTTGLVETRVRGSRSQGLHLFIIVHLISYVSYRVNTHHNKAAGFERRLEVGKSDVFTYLFTYATQVYLVENFRHSFEMERCVKRVNPTCRSL
jgi:hypothetical protein